MGKITYHVKPKSTDPIKQIRAENSAGYLDLVLSLTKNGKAIRIANRLGEERVFVTLDKLDTLIEDLKLIKSRGVKVSVSEVEYDTSSACRKAA
jgi:hypothetical protein